MSTLSQTIRDVVWARRGPGGWAGWLGLQPLSALFALGVELRDAGYRLGVLQSERAAIPVVSVGNLTVGGTGKTPLTLWLARRLTTKGYNVAILLRGYSGSAREATIVSRGQGLEAPVELVGDEAAMLAKCFAGTVLTARKRIGGVRLAQSLGCDLVLLDDGFQHRALARDFDLVVVSSRRGGMLPAGPMRERWGALRRADAVALAIRGEEEAAEPLPAGVAALGLPTFVVRFRPNSLVGSVGGLWQELPIAAISGARVTVVSGIAEPVSFYQTLRGWGANVQEIFEYPDHHRYTPDDWQRINRQTQAVDFVVTTEKDLIKLERFPFAKDKLVAVRIEPEVDDAAALVALIERRLAARVASWTQADKPTTNTSEAQTARSHVD